MSLTPGTRLGPYQILSALGAGGMGEVYKARDTRLDRTVAIKILPEAFAADADRVARFQREAKTLAALNHPNIAQIFGLEQAGDVQALAMEFVAGEDLSERIARGPIPLDDALPIAKQVAEALEAAHEQGIIHRDLKPANIKVREDGTVKVLDFGLAKLVDPTATSNPNLTMSPTITTPAMTQAGMILGTAAYMSPEQARGKTVDRRADVWAFGCVLYEMLTGQRAFKGEEISDVLAAVLRQDMDWSTLPAATPAGLRRLLVRCLDRDPKRRLRDIGEARVEIDEALAGTGRPSETGAVSPASPAPGWRRTVSWAITTLLVGAGLSSAIFVGRTSAPAPRLAHFVIETTEAAPIRADNLGGGLAISPDGSRIVYRTSRELSQTSGRLFVRAVDQVQAIALRGADGASAPVFSRDGQWIAYVDGRDGALKRIPVRGGAPETVCSLEGAQLRGASWGADDTIVFATNVSKGLLRVPAAGGKAERLTTADAVSGEDHWWPEVLPNGRAVLFTVSKGSLMSARVAIVLLSTGQVTPLLDGTSPRFSPTGHLVFGTADGALRAVGFDAQALRTIGTPVTVGERVGIGQTGAAEFAVAADGSLVYATGSVGVPPRTLVWVDRAGHEEAIPTPPRAYTYARLSPDGTRVALDVRDQQNDIWIWDLNHKTLQRLTNDPGMNRSPAWTPDGKRVAFSAVRDGVESIYWQAFDGSGTMERLSSGTQYQNPQSFSPDGTQLLFLTPTSPPFDLGIITLGATPTTAMLLHSAASEVNGEISPDGRWLAYESNESTRNEIYVRPFPDVNAGRRQVSTAGGTRPLWSRDGYELFYHVAPDTIMAVPVRLSANRPNRAAPDITLGDPQPIVKGPYAQALNAGRHYDVSPDGRRFLLLKDAPAPDGQKPAAPEIHWVLNWTEELKARVPTK